VLRPYAGPEAVGGDHGPRSLWCFSLTALANRKSPGLLGKLLFQTAANQLAQPNNRRIGDRVKNLKSFLSAREDVRLCEGLEVPGNVRLGAPDFSDERVHVFFPFKEGMDQPQPHGFGEDGKAPGNQFNGFGRQGRALGHAKNETYA